MPSIFISFLLLASVFRMTASTTYLQESFPEVCYTIIIDMEGNPTQDFSGYYTRLNYKHWCYGRPAYVRDSGTYLYYFKGDKDGGRWLIGNDLCVPWSVVVSATTDGFSPEKNAIWTQTGHFPGSVKVKANCEEVVEGSPSFQWAEKWLQSSAFGGEQGRWGLDSGQGDQRNLGLVPLDLNRDYAIVHKFNGDSHQKSMPLMVQFAVEIPETANQDLCTSVHIKVFPSVEVSQVSSRSPYLLSFGPTVCTSRTGSRAAYLELYLSLPNGASMTKSKVISIQGKGLPHLYHLKILPDKTYEAGINGIGLMTDKITGSVSICDRCQVLQKLAHNLGPGIANDHFAFLKEASSIGFSFYLKIPDIVIDDILVTSDVASSIEHQEKVINRFKSHRATHQRMVDSNQQISIDEMEEEDVLMRERRVRNVEEILQRMKQTVESSHDKISNGKWEAKKQLELQAKQLEMEQLMAKIAERALEQMNKIQAISSQFSVHDWDHALIAMATACQTVVIIMLLWKMNSVQEITIVERVKPSEENSVQNGAIPNKIVNGTVVPQETQTRSPSKEIPIPSKITEKYSQHLEAARKKNGRSVRRSMSCDMDALLK